MKHCTYSVLIVCISAAFSLAVIFLFNLNGYTYSHDDAYISYRYAQNFALGRGLVFNSSEHVFGFTSPLQVLVLCVVAILGLDLPVWCFALSIIWIGLSAVQLYYILIRFFNQTLSFFICTYFLTCGMGYGYLGLESALLILLQLSFLYSALRKHFVRASLLGALACLARPDSVMLVFPILLMIKIWKKPAGLILFAVPGLAWCAFSYFYYGSAIPHTFYAKMGVSKFEPYFQHVFTKLTHEPYLTMLFGKKLTCLIAVFFNLFNLANPRLKNASCFIFALVLYPWIIIFSYSAIAPNIGHDWELASAYYFFRLGVITGLSFFLIRAVQLILKTFPLKVSQRTLIYSKLILLVFMLSVFITNSYRSWGILVHTQTAYWFGGRHLMYNQISAWLKSNLPIHSRIAVQEPGTIAYLTDFYLVDLPGIVTQFEHKSGLPNFNRIIEHYRPDYLLFKGHIPALNYASQLEYRLVKYFPRSSFADHSLLKRK